MTSNGTITAQVKLARIWKEATVTYFMPCYALCTGNVRKSVEILSENRDVVVPIWRCCTNNWIEQSAVGHTVLPAGSDIKEKERIGRRACKTTETLGKSQKGQRIGQSSKTSSHSSSCASASRERT